jgi:hypothetical protein
MFYVANVSNWLDEVIHACNARSIDAEQSIFSMALFSSLDSSFVAYFRKMKAQISKFTGDKFHIFTPIIYEDNIVPDTEVRELRANLIQDGSFRMG